MLLGLMAGGCAPNATTFRYEQPASRQCEAPAVAELVGKTDALSVWSYQGRLYVLGAEEAGRTFKDAPLAGTGIAAAGAGPAGEEVVFASQEVRERYRRLPKLLRRVGREYSLWQREDRLFILGPNTPVEQEFGRTGELAISKTFFDAGPHGETVVVEANKNKNQYADLLMARYQARPVLIDHACPDYFVWQENGRLIVLGSALSSTRLESGHGLPDTRAVIGVGPQGETVAFEADRRRPELLRRLAARFFGAGKVPPGVVPE
jgi:hypothetical protein